VHEWLLLHNQNIFSGVIQKPVDRWTVYVEKDGDYKENDEVMHNPLIVLFRKN
jgi:hypothetical protein